VLAQHSIAHVCFEPFAQWTAPGRWCPLSPSPIPYHSLTPCARVHSIRSFPWTHSSLFAISMCESLTRHLLSLICFLSLCRCLHPSLHPLLPPSLPPFLPLTLPLSSCNQLFDTAFTIALTLLLHRVHVFILSLRQCIPPSLPPSLPSSHSPFPLRTTSCSTRRSSRHSVLGSTMAQHLPTAASHRHQSNRVTIRWMQPPQTHSTHPIHPQHAPNTTSDAYPNAPPTYPCSSTSNASPAPPTYPSPSTANACPTPPIHILYYQRSSYTTTNAFPASPMHPFYRHDVGHTLTYSAATHSLCSVYLLLFMPPAVPTTTRSVYTPHHVSTHFPHSGDHRHFLCSMRSLGPSHAHDRLLSAAGEVTVGRPSLAGGARVSSDCAC
jgi:hypothetical protein